MHNRSSIAEPAKPSSDFDLSNVDHLIYFLGLHHRKVDAFKAYAAAHFPNIDYSQLKFRPYDKSALLNMLCIANSTPPYLNYDENVVKISDDDTSDNDNLKFEVMLKSEAAKSPGSSYFPLLLFICIMEFYKTDVHTPGDQIDGDIEFSWGKREDITTRLVLTVIFRFKLKNGEWQFYDYSSEYPTALPPASLYKLKSELMNA